MEAKTTLDLFYTSWRVRKFGPSPRPRAWKFRFLREGKGICLSSKRDSGSPPSFPSWCKRLTRDDSTTWWENLLIAGQYANLFQKHLIHTQKKVLQVIHGCLLAQSHWPVKLTITDVQSGKPALNGNSPPYWRCEHCLNL